MSGENVSAARKRVRKAVDGAECSTTSVHRRTLRRQRALGDSEQLGLPAYSDLGDCNCRCESCGALFWFAERVACKSRVGRPQYNQCCKSGTVKLNLPEVPPVVLLQFFQDPHFMENVRCYNNMFSMTSFGAKVDESVNDCRGPYVFKISGQVCHWIGSMSPEGDSPPCFLQMYIYDTENEVSNRIRIFGNTGRRPLSPSVVTVLSNILNTHHKYVRLFKTAYEISNMFGEEEYAVHLYDNVHDRRYEHSVDGVIGGIVCGDDTNASEYDIIVYSRAGYKEEVSKLHPCYMPLQYPLLFPHGEHGWSRNMVLQLPDGSVGRRLTVNMFYSYILHDRDAVYSHVLKGGRLFQQYLVDAYTCVEQNRLDFIRMNQESFRTDYVSGVYDAISRGESSCHEIGKRVILPASFVGGPRYMYKHYHDTLALCRVYGNPQYFVMFMCNVKWPEIQRYMRSLGCSQVQNRPDIVCRVFHMKLMELIKFVKDDKTFGDVAAYLYTVELQKRGLPHCHLLLWVTSPFKIEDATSVDTFISAKLPDPTSEPLLYKTVTDCMLHGPYGLLNPSAPCMKNGQCSKKFPKPFEQLTWFDKEGYVYHKRTRDRTHILPKGIQIDSGYVVLHKKRLCSRFNVHINVEYCGWNMMIKYLFKYISKGADRVRFAVRRSSSDATTSSRNGPSSVNEIKNFLNGHFICPHEAAWRILNFDIHERHPAVQILVVHLQNKQQVSFSEGDTLDKVVGDPSFAKTTLPEWFTSNREHNRGHNLTYVEYPSEFRWLGSRDRWVARSEKGYPSIGRLTYVHLISGELFYLRMLLCHQRGSTSFVDLWTVEGVVHSTCRAACEALGLLVNDQEWALAFAEAVAWATSAELRALFCHLLLYSDIGDPNPLWDTQWKKMTDDLLLSLKSLSGNPELAINDFDLQHQVLLELDPQFCNSTKVTD